MTANIFADPTFESPPTREQRRLALTVVDSTRPVDARSMDIGPDTSDPLGRLLNAAYKARAAGAVVMSIDEVIRLATQQFGGAA